jgi:hypothetical protein
MILNNPARISLFLRNGRESRPVNIIHPQCKRKICLVHKFFQVFEVLKGAVEKITSVLCHSALTKLKTATLK